MEVSAAGELREVSAPAAPAKPKVPPPGPVWFGSAMGTGILSNLTQTLHASIPFGHQISVSLLVIGWIVILVLSLGFIARIVRSAEAFTTTLTDNAVAPTWGMVCMGILSIGSATAVVLPTVDAGWTHLAWTVDAVMWCLGTFIGVVAALGFGGRLIGRHIGAPTTVWGLAVVGPMVSATTGAALVPHLSAIGAELWLLVATVACFFLSLFIGTMIFAVAYHHHWRLAPVPLALSASAWIPLGMVGQSTAAAQAMAGQAVRLVVPEAQTAVQSLANLYGYCMLGLGAPLIVWAILTTVRGFLGRMPFSPGWWSLTFPIGTLSLGSTLLGHGSGLSFFSVAGIVACSVLMGTWTLCAVSSLRAIVRVSLAHRALTA